eukprot:9476536-Pyramimonas_sp.AAC.1
MARRRGAGPAARQRGARLGGHGGAEGERLRRAGLDEHQRAREAPRGAVVAALARGRRASSGRPRPAGLARSP